MRQLGRRYAGAGGKAYAVEGFYGRLHKGGIGHHRTEEAETGALPRLHAQHDDAQRGGCLRDRGDLEGAALPEAGTLRHAQATVVAPEEADRAAVWLQAAGNLVDERRLPRAVRADECVNLAALQVEVDAIGCLQRAEALGKAADLQYRFSHGAPSRR